MNAIRDGNHMRVYDAFMIRESIKEIDGRKYDADNKCWLVPYSVKNAKLLAILGVELEEGLLPTEPDLISEDEKPIIPMPIKATPYQHQVRAYNFALRLFGIGGST